MTEKSGALRLPDVPRIKHPFRFTGIMTFEFLIVHKTAMFQE